MPGQTNIEPMLEMFCFETNQYLAQLEQSMITSEKSKSIDDKTINEIFRIMHNIKSSAAMMLFNNIAVLAHNIEDLFFFIREQNTPGPDCSVLSDLVLDAVDFIKLELEKIKNGDSPDGDNTFLLDDIRKVLKGLERTLAPDVQISRKDSRGKANKQQYYLSKDTKALSLKSNFYKAIVYFQDGCEMENVRAYAIVHHLKEFAEDIYYTPADIIENDDSVFAIREFGFETSFRSNRGQHEIQKFFNNTAFVRDLELVQLHSEKELTEFAQSREDLDKSSIIIPALDKERITVDNKDFDQTLHKSNRQSIISVSVNKLDMLMDLVGEMVTAEAMVTQNPDLLNLELDNFRKAARQLRKITSEVQDIVMSIRMVPLDITLQKMHRIVRDMSRKLNKELVLQISGEETEVDKNIIEKISDPLMHLVRNAVDHGLESKEERIKAGKSEMGKILIEARNAGSEVLIMVKDNGRGLDKDKILSRAQANDLLDKPVDELSDKEIFNLILLPGFSTKDKTSEFSGRGVGMDVVAKSIESVGGSILIDSKAGVETTITLKIPLTLAIIDGMNIKVGKSCYTLPLTSIRESFRPQESEVITDPDGNEMIMLRGACFPVLRLHQVFRVKTEVGEFTEGIIVMVEDDGKSLCLFADCLLGEQQVVVKALPNYIKKVRGVAGCTLLGDGSISLILDIADLFSY